jgi:hypothetical protein
MKVFDKQGAGCLEYAEIIQKIAIKFSGREQLSGILKASSSLI